MLQLKKVAFIGTGAMARAHAEAFQDIPNVELVGAMGRNLENLSSFTSQFNIPIMADTVGQLYRQTNADLVVVAVSELSAKTLIEAAAQYSWDILAEKPTGINLNEAYNLRIALGGATEKLFVGFNRRHYSSTRQMFDSINSIENGVRYIEVCDQEHPLNAETAGRPKQVTENWMFANSIHLIDYFNLFARGEISSLTRRITELSSNSFVLNAEMGFESGDVGYYTAVWNAPGPWGFKCWAGNTFWESRPLERAISRTGDGPEVELKVHEWDIRFKPGIRMQAEEVIHHIENGTSKVPKLSDSIKTMEIVDRIYNMG